MLVPWNAMWTGEERYEVRPCRYANGDLAIWAPQHPGVGRPMFAEPHPVRQRLSICRMICTVCGEPTPKDDRWWFALGEEVDGGFRTTEAPVHHRCALVALENCPHLKRNGCAGDLSRMPGGYRILASIVGGQKMEEDFGIKVNGRRIVGALKIDWPAGRIRVVRRESTPRPG